MRILKANTAVRLVVGPLCDKTTGLAKPSMTVTNMAMNMWHEHDDGSAPTKSIDAVSFTASGGSNDMVELAGGYYDIEITAAQLNITAGRCGFLIYDDDVILPYFEEWLVVPANVFDSIMGTDKLDVNAAELGGTSQTGNDVGADVNDILADTGTDGVIVASIANDAITAAAITADAITEIQNGLATPTNITAGTITTVTNLTNLPAITANWLTAAGIDATAVTELQAGLALEATLTAIKGAGWSTETLKAIKTAVDAIDTSGVAAAVWAAAVRTLTQSAASVTATVSGSDITCTRGDSLSASLTDVGALTGYSKIYFTVKRDHDDADSVSIIQIEKTAGLKYIDGAAAVTAANGTITITDEATGDITIALDEAETAKLDAGVYYYDVQIVRSAGTVSTLTSGEFTVSADVTRATT